jgi:uncharacterized membrane protein
MSKIYRTAAAAAIAVSAATSLMMVEPASAAPRRAATVDYCMAFEGGNDCSFTTKAQCDASASGLNAECYRNVYGKEGETLHW